MAREHEHNRGRANWDKPMTALLLDICKAEKKVNNFDNYKGFTKDGWKQVCLKFNEESSKNYNWTQLQSKFNTLRKEWMVRKENTTRSGLGHNRSNDVVTSH